MLVAVRCYWLGSKFFVCHRITKMWPLTLLLFVNTMWEDEINNSSGIDSAIWVEIPDPGKFSTFYKTGKRKKK